MITLSDVTELIVDSEHKTAPKAETGHPLVRTSDIKRGRIELSNIQRVSEETYEQWTRRAVPQAGDLILAREAPVGNVAVVTDGMNPVLGQRTVLLRPDRTCVDPTYLCALLLGDEAQYWMNAVANGATVPHLNMSDIRSLKLPELPDLETQRRTGAAIASFDDLIENNRRRIEILEEMARLLYREWFVQFRFPGHEDVELVDSELGPIPEEWEILDLADCCSQLQAGGTPKRKEAAFWDSHDLDWYKTGELQDDFLFESEEGISAVAAKSARTFEPGTILMAIYGSPTVGRLGVLTKAASCNQAALALVGKPAVVTQTFLFYKLWELRAMFNSIAQGAAQQNISKEKVARARIAVPPLALVREFDAHVSVLWSLRENLGRQVRVLREARDLLLPRLVSGELDVSELDLDGVLA